ncbi:MAG: DUF5683 domain-containing protein [Flavobacteriales bacterium]|nr:DUF5683 domain-containing protein [Flavobacteriales bacterium]
MAAAFSFRSMVLVASILIAFGAQGQTTQVESSATERIKRTTRMAAFLPGSGQVINKKYWKAPIVWGGWIYCISAIQFNQQQLNLYRNTIIADGNGTELPDPNIGGSESEWRQLETAYQKQRDLSYLALAGVHLLSILDAHVDANLMSFDVGEDLSLHLVAIPMSITPVASAFGIQFNWNLGRIQHSELADHLPHTSKSL